jgi:hypothetical protein
MRLRFSMRWILAITTIMVILCGFVIHPTLVAQRLATEVNNGNFRQLVRLEITKQLWQYKRSDGQKYSLEELRIEAALHPRSWRDFFTFRRRVSINVWPPLGAPESVPAATSSYVFVRTTGSKAGGESWE